MKLLIVDFAHSVHLYYLFPSLEEGGLATYRTAIVQNQHLAMLAKVRVPPEPRPLREAVERGCVGTLAPCFPLQGKEAVCLPLQACNWS